MPWPEGAKELLQVGSLIEREFAYRLIRAAIHLPDQELLRRLSILKDAELLYERGLFPDSTFVFKHALTREVVYGTLLEGKKKELHLDIGRAIEGVYKKTSRRCTALWPNTSRKAATTKRRLNISVGLQGRRGEPLRLRRP